MVLVVFGVARRVYMLLLLLFAFAFACISLGSSDSKCAHACKAVIVRSVLLFRTLNFEALLALVGVRCLPFVHSRIHPFGCVCFFCDTCLRTNCPIAGHAAACGSIYAFLLYGMLAGNVKGGTVQQIVEWLIDSGQSKQNKTEKKHYEPHSNK